MGGHVGLIFAKEHPEMVDGLILTGSSGLYENAMGDSFLEEEIMITLNEKQKRCFMTLK